MGYFDGLDQKGLAELVQGDVDFKRDQFRTWRRFIDRMEKLVYREVGETAQQRWNQYRVFNESEVSRARKAQYLSTDVRKMVQTFIKRMIRSRVIIEGASLSDVAEEKAKVSTLERFCLGLMNHLDEQVVGSHRGFSLVGQLSNSVARTGKIVQRVRMTDGPNGPMPVWEVLDPYNVYHDFGGTPKRIVNEYWDNKHRITQTLEAIGLSLPEKLRKKGSRDAIRFTDFYVEDVDGLVYNAVLLDNEMVGRPRLLSQFKSLPFDIISMGDDFARYQDPDLRVPGVGDGDALNSTFIDRHAQPFYAIIEHTVQQIEDAYSLEFQMAALATNPPKIITRPMTSAMNAGDDQGNEIDVGDIGPGTTIDVDEGTSVEFMRLAFAGLQSFQAPARLERDISAIWPSALDGASSGAAESGFHFFQRLDASKNAIVSPALVVAIALKKGLVSLVEQARERGDKIQLNLTPESGESAGKFYLTDFNARQDIPKTYAIHVTVPPMVPDDDLKRAQVAQATMAVGVSREKTLSEVMGIQDAVGEMERTALEQMRERPEAQDARMVRALWIEVANMEADAAQEDDERLKLIKRKFAIQARIQAQRIEERIFGGMGGPQQAPSLPGIAPEQQPPEARGAENPDLRAAIAGGTQSYMGGSPGGAGVPGEEF